MNAVHGTHMQGCAWEKDLHRHKNNASHRPFQGTLPSFGGGVASKQAYLTAMWMAWWAENMPRTPPELVKVQFIKHAQQPSRPTDTVPGLHPFGLHALKYTDVLAVAWVWVSPGLTRFRLLGCLPKTALRCLCSCNHAVTPDMQLKHLLPVSPVSVHPGYDTLPPNAMLSIWDTVAAPAPQPPGGGAPPLPSSPVLRVLVPAAPEVGCITPSVAERALLVARVAAIPTLTRLTLDGLHVALTGMGYTPQRTWGELHSADAAAAAPVAWALMLQQDMVVRHRCVAAEALLAQYCLSRLVFTEAGVVASWESWGLPPEWRGRLSRLTGAEGAAVRTFHMTHYHWATPVPTVVWRVPWARAGALSPVCGVCTDAECVGAPLVDGCVVVTYLQAGWVLHELVRGRMLAADRPPLPFQDCGLHTQVKSTVEAGLHTAVQPGGGAGEQGVTLEAPWAPKPRSAFGKPKGVVERCSDKHPLEWVRSHFPPCLQILVSRKFPRWMGGETVARQKHPDNDQRFLLVGTLARIPEQVMSMQHKQAVWFAAFQEDAQAYTSQFGLRGQAMFFEKSEAGRYFRWYMKKHSSLLDTLAGNPRGSGGAPVPGCRAFRAKGACPVAAAAGSDDAALALFRGAVDGDVNTTGLQEFKEAMGTGKRQGGVVDIEDCAGACGAGCNAFMRSRHPTALTPGQASGGWGIRSPLAYVVRATRKRETVGVQQGQGQGPDQGQGQGQGMEVDAEVVGAHEMEAM